MLTAFPLEASSNLSGRLPLHVAFFVSEPGTFFCDAAEAGVVSRACEPCQAWMLYHSALAVHELAAGSFWLAARYCAHGRGGMPLV